MSKIKLLDDLTIQKIAAGEVIERPASIVKELIENSLDANSKDIIVEIKNGGKSYIRVTDTGDGIEYDSIDLAFKRHSTSKLSKIEDLYKIRSLGFRGEALASISNVAKVELMTKTEGAKAGVRARVLEGSLISKEAIGSPKGTTFIVEDLFYNLPVRKEFLKTDLTESNRVSDVVYKAALGAPSVNFRFVKDNKVVLNTVATDNLRNHIYSVLGRDFSSNLIELNYKDEYMSISGFISNNKLYRGSRAHQYLYVNNRYVENSSISKLIETEYRSTIPLKRYPVFILFLDIDPEDIDINIHPTKQEIKFLKEEHVFEKIGATIKTSLESQFRIPDMKINRRQEEKEAREEINRIPSIFELMDKKIENKKLEIDSNSDDYRDSVYVREKLEEKEPISFEDEYRQISDSATPSREEPEESEAIDDLINRLEAIGVIFKTYIIAKDEKNRALYFIDQHAAHERIMYEKYLEEYRNEQVYSQQLLSPEIYKLTDSEMNKLKENLELFRGLGFEIDEFGNDSIIIRGVPFIFGNPNIKGLFFEILDNLHRDIESNYDFNVDKIMKISCVNSVKSGDGLSEDEILSLFYKLKQTKHPYSCPHGRPTMLKMDEKDIEKEFLRIV